MTDFTRNMHSERLNSSLSTFKRCACFEERVRTVIVGKRVQRSDYRRIQVVVAETSFDTRNN